MNFLAVFKYDLSNFGNAFHVCQIISMRINETTKTIYVGCTDGIVHIWQLSENNAVQYIQNYHTNNGPVLSLTGAVGYSV